MKQNGETTDIDFFSPDFQNTGLIQKSRGEALTGRPPFLWVISVIMLIWTKTGRNGQEQCLSDGYIGERITSGSDQ